MAFFRTMLLGVGLILVGLFFALRPNQVQEFGRRLDPLPRSVRQSSVLDFLVGGGTPVLVIRVVGALCTLGGAFLIWAALFGT